MIKALIFSKDRALQLRLLLNSMQINCKDAFDVTILYKASNITFKEGYSKLISEGILPNIHWIEEEEFKLQVLEFLEHGQKYTTFFTDDDIVYRPFDASNITSTLDSDHEIFCFSGRLGVNVTKCYTMRASNILGDFEEDITTGIIKWDWTKRYLDFGYPLSVDFHVFRTSDIKKLISKIAFHNPNTLEGNLQMFDNYPKNKMAAFKHSVMVNSPSNIVNDTHPNRKGEQFGISAEELNKKYLEGEIIDLESLDFSNIQGCHQELALTYKQHEATTQQ